MEGGSARITIYRPSPVGLSLFGMKRLVPDSLRDRSPQTLERFDNETMFFDVFRPVSDGSVICLGPPLDGCVPGNRVLLASGANDSPLSLHSEPPRIEQQHTSRLLVSGLDVDNALLLEAGGRRLPIAVNQPHAHLLADRRVLMTLSKDNPLVWIRDWVTFYVQLHGADAVLLYDNGSQSYAPDEIAAALSDVAGLCEIVIVVWPFRYGVGGRSGEPTPDNFCQTGALDHARRCFCLHARSILNVDIDELLPPGEVSIFERVETSPYAVLLFRGVWAEAPDIDNPETARRLRHRDCSFAWQSQLNMLALGKDETLCRTKWVAVPSRCSPNVEWGVHDIYPADAHAHATQRSWRMLDRSTAYRHCRQINTSWKTERWRSSDDFDRVCSPDQEMSAAFARAFGEPAA